MAAYQLAVGWNNAVGFVAMAAIITDGRRLAHITSLGSFQAAREVEGLDALSRDDGDDMFTWTFEWMSPEEIAYIRTTFIGGALSGPVTVETRDDERVWVERNANLLIHRNQSLRGEYFGPVVFEFKKGHAPA